MNVVKSIFSFVYFISYCPCAMLVEILVRISPVVVNLHLHDPGLRNVEYEAERKKETGKNQTPESNGPCSFGPSPGFYPRIFVDYLQALKTRIGERP